MMTTHGKTIAMLVLVLLPLGCTGLDLNPTPRPDVTKVATTDANWQPLPASTLPPVSNKPETPVATDQPAKPGEHRTANFIIKAPTPELAERLGEWAEYHRREKARAWLGEELPTWTMPCVIDIHVRRGEAGGATTFAFDQGRVIHHEMYLEGSAERLVASGLPHEIAHLIFAHRFGRPLPRWADEGAAVYSEDSLSHDLHETMCREVLQTPGRAMSLRRLFGLKDYPSDALVLYAQGYSVTNFLVGRSSPQAFLAFVAAGMNGDWDRALQQHYRFRSVEELEQAWLGHVRSGWVVASAEGERYLPESLPGNDDTGRPHYLPETSQTSTTLVVAARKEANPPHAPAIRLGLPLGLDNER